MKMDRYIYTRMFSIICLVTFVATVQSLDCFSTPRYRNCNFHAGLSGDACILACMYPSQTATDIQKMFQDIYITDYSLARLEYVYQPSHYGDWMCPPMYIGGLRRLVDLSLTGIDDAIFSTNLIDVMLANLRSLRSFNMRDNTIKANYPNFKNNPSLTEIRLVNNRFVGSLPDTWSTLKNLSSLTISRADI
jgi:hypothetical protein